MCKPKNNGVVVRQVSALLDEMEDILHRLISMNKRWQGGGSSN